MTNVACWNVHCPYYSKNTGLCIRKMVIINENGTCRTLYYPNGAPRQELPPFDPNLVNGVVSKEGENDKGLQRTNNENESATD